MQKPGAAYRVTYRRRGWAHSKSVALLSERGARSFADRLTRTKDVKPLTEVSIEVMGGLWMPLADGPQVGRIRRTADPHIVEIQ